MISDEAVEAAARVYRDQQAELGYPKWDDLGEDGREWRLGYMRAALEAAAPYMLVEAMAAVPYYQEQHDTKPNPHTAARLTSAQRTLDIMEELQ